MGLFSYFKRRRKTLNPGFQNYKNPRVTVRKAFVQNWIFQKSTAPKIAGLAKVVQNPEIS